MSYDGYENYVIDVNNKNYLSNIINTIIDIETEKSIIDFINNLCCADCDDKFIKKVIDRLQKTLTEIGG